MFQLFLSKILPSQSIPNVQTDDNIKESSLKHKVIFMSRKEFKQPIQDEYVKALSELPPDKVYDGYNPGSTKPDGSVNFECHCVSHLVGSPCGFEFRRAITCQKTTSDEDLEKGSCADEFMEFMRCAIKTQCFRLRDDKNGAEEKPAQ